MLKTFYWIKLNYKLIFSYWYKWTTIFCFIAGGLFPFPALIGNNRCLRIGILIVVGLVIFIGVAIRLYRKNTILIWKRGTGSINICYGDLFKIALKDTNKNKFIVIPVNATFDTIVDGPDITRPLVSDNTLHGKWLNRCNEWGLSIENIDKQIENVLSNVAVFKTLTENQKARGKLQEYPIGTIAPIKGTHNTIFLLTALSVFDEQNNAQPTGEILSDVIKSIVKYGDENGQGNSIYLPVMGTGLSRMNLGNNEAFRLIKYGLLAYTLKIHAKITIVVYVDSKNEISIWD